MDDDKVKELIRWYTKEYAPFHNGIENRRDRPAEKLAKKNESEILAEMTGDKEEGTGKGGKKKNSDGTK